MRKDAFIIVAFLLTKLIHVEGIVLKEFPLEDVQINQESIFYKAQEADKAYLYALDADRLLAPFLKEAGITPLKPNYPNWESMGLDGHTAGHYLSALSMMYATTRDSKLLERLQYMIFWLDSCQKKNGDDYVGGVPDGKSLWNDIKNGKIDAGSFSLGNRWVPLYNLHKTFAGLRDAYLFAHQKKALEILIKLTDWFESTTQHLSDEQVQQILNTEHGGLNEVFVQLGEITKNQKYIKLAERFSHRAILMPLIEQKDILAGLHANTQIPKVIGFKCIADASQNKQWDSAAQFFWDIVTQKYTISIGGHGVREHFNPSNNFKSIIESNQGPETCNSYNMLKLTKLLFLSSPHVKYIDYYERTLYNHILSTINTQRPGLVYFTPMHPCHYRVYSTVENSFWCCVGTGMENHAKYGEMIYAHEENSLWVNLFIASQLNWKEKQLTLIQNTEFPYKESTLLTIQTKKKQKLTFYIRKPSWIKDKFLMVSINNQQPIQIKSDNGYITIDREWKNGDKIEIQLPQSLSVEYLPDRSPWVSFLYGPIVLANVCDTSQQVGLWADDSRMAHVANGPLYPINEQPFIISEHNDLLKKVKKTDENKLLFILPVRTPREEETHLILKPFFEVMASRYTIYFPVFTENELIERKKEWQREEEKKLILQRRTIDEIAPGEQQSEVGHNFRGEKTEWGVNQNRFWRHAYGWFAYDLSNKNKQAKYIELTFYGLDNHRTFDVLINDIKLTTIQLKGDKGDTFFSVEYEIPESVLKSNATEYTIKFLPHPGSLAGGVYYIRLLKE